MRTKNLLLIIDMQNDFCNPKGSLYVEGAEKDAKNLSRFIEQNEQSIDKIVLTQDSHQVIDISHPAFWENKEKINPDPFTLITLDDINNQKWTPKYLVQNAIDYIQLLSEQGEFPHIIWPEHCIAGSWGAAFEDGIIEALENWARKGKFFEVIQKGMNPLTEHFGALRANIPDTADKQTLLNQMLLENLKQYQKIVIAGEAKSHCVANTIKQICEFDDLASKLVILEDAMSNVSGFEELATPIYAEAQDLGATFTNTSNLILN